MLSRAQTDPQQMVDISRSPRPLSSTPRGRSMSLLTMLGKLTPTKMNLKRNQRARHKTDIFTTGIDATEEDRLHKKPKQDSEAGGKGADQGTGSSKVQGSGKKPKQGVEGKGADKGTGSSKDQRSDKKTKQVVEGKNAHKGTGSRKDKRSDKKPQQGVEGKGADKGTGSRKGVSTDKPSGKGKGSGRGSDKGKGSSKGSKANKAKGITGFWRTDKAKAQAKTRASMTGPGYIIEDSDDNTEFVGFVSGSEAFFLRNPIIEHSAEGEGAGGGNHSKGEGAGDGNRGKGEGAGDGKGEGAGDGNRSKGEGAGDGNRSQRHGNRSNGKGKAMRIPVGHSAEGN